MSNLAAALVSLLIVIPVCGMLVTGGVLANTTGSEQFYQASIGVLSALLIAFVFQFKPFIEDVYAILGRADSVLLIPILVSWLGSFIGGVAFSLGALQSCKDHSCGGSGDFNNVLVALIVASIYLVVAFVAAAIAAHRAEA
jgi:hypothetical protein